MMKRKIIENMPLINNTRLCYKKEYIYAEDYKLWAELAMKDYRFANIPEILVKYRISENQNTNRYNKEMQETTLKIQHEYVEYVMEKMVESDDKFYELLNPMIELHNDGTLSFPDVRKIVYILFTAFLRINEDKD